MELDTDVSIGLHLQAKTEEEISILISTLGKLAEETNSLFKVSLMEKEGRFTKERYFRELKSQISISSGYSSFDSISSICKSKRSNLLSSQALSVILHIEQNIENDKLANVLQHEPWRFHHTMQLLDWENSCVVAKQDFFELSPELPLVNVSLNSTRNIIRYNLFVKNIRRMRRFYEDLLSMSPTFVSEDGYCCFILKSNPDYEIQFSLKRSRHLDIVVGKHSQLILEFPRNSSLFGRLVGKTIIETCDPEGNELLLIARSIVATENIGKGRMLQRSPSIQSSGSSTVVGDCSLIRTRRKTSNRSSSTSESEASSNSSPWQDGIIYSGHPIVL